MQRLTRMVTFLALLSSAGCTVNATDTLPEDELLGESAEEITLPAPAAACATVDPDVEVDPWLLPPPEVYHDSWISPSSSYNHPGCGKYFIVDVWDHGAMKNALDEYFFKFDAFELASVSKPFCPYLRSTVHVYRRYNQQWVHVGGRRESGKWVTRADGTGWCSTHEAIYLRNENSDIPGSNWGYRLLTSIDIAGLQQKVEADIGKYPYP